MNADALSFLKNLMKQSSPSGFEVPAQKVIRARMQNVADRVTGDVHGNLIGALNEKARVKVMLAGHVDEIGLMITHIDANGFIFFAAIGGWDPLVAVGQRVCITTTKGPIYGVIGRKPIHLMDIAERDKGVKLEDLWIDIGAKNKKAAAGLVSIGDPVTYLDDYLELKTGLVVARAFDNRIGSFIVAEILRVLSESKTLKAAVHSVSTVQEEIGLRGAHTSAYGVDPQIGIATDVTFATDQPGVDPKHVGDIKLGEGPVLARGPNINPRVFDLLVDTAKKKKILYQVEGISRATGTDANAIQLTRAGVAAGLVSVPLRYMHTPVETLDPGDVENTVKLMASFAEALAPDMSFIP